MDFLIIFVVPCFFLSIMLMYLSYINKKAKKSIHIPKHTKDYLNRIKEYNYIKSYDTVDYYQQCSKCKHRSPVYKKLE